jgi:hypothetical protein
MQRVASKRDTRERKAAGGVGGRGEGVGTRKRYDDSSDRTVVQIRERPPYDADHVG